MIYVDNLKMRGMHFCGKAMESCHLISDSGDEELIEFAFKLGLKKSYMHKSKSGNHFDLIGRKREQAIEMGAKELIRKNEIK